MTSRHRFEDDVIAAVQRGLRRAGNEVHFELARGLPVLATIAATAPFIGLFGTVFGLVFAFRGCDAPPAVCNIAVAQGVADALLTTAAGLLVAILSSWPYNYFTQILENFDIENVLCSKELVTYLAIRRHRMPKHLGRDGVGSQC